MFESLATVSTGNVEVLVWTFKGQVWSTEFGEMQ
jgi:hypothetical protein